jgi:hypothetical protein
VTYKILSLFILVLSLHSKSGAACLDSYKVINKSQLQTGSLNSTLCFLSVGPFDEINLIYRDYIFTSDSSLMIFNSYGDGPDSTSTGAREFMFFPRKQILNFVEKTKALEIQLNDLHFSFDTETNKFFAIDGIEFQEAKKVEKTNHGGFEILSSQTLYLDLGFRMGGSPRVQANRKVQFHDRQNFTCEVLNSDIFDYTKDVYNPSFKFESDEALASFLKIRCAHLIN